MRLSIAIIVFGSLLGGGATCFGGSVLFSNSLPTNNLNDPAGAQRSNIAFGETDPTATFDGTNVVFNSYGAHIDTISFWSVASTYGEALGNEFSSVSLYFRPLGGTWQVLQTGSVDTTFDVPSNPNAVGSSNAKMQFIQTSYTGSVTPANSYEGDGTPGVYYPLWQNVFSGLDLQLNRGVTYQFGINGVGANPDPNTLYGFWYSAFVNAPRSGTSQSDTSGVYQRCGYADLSAPCFVENPQADQSWDKPANMNIQLTGTATPEPGSAVSLVLGLFALSWIARRRRQA